MNWIKERLNEPSTWTSAAVLVLSAGVFVHWFYDPRWLGQVSGVATLLAFIGFIGHDRDNKLF